MSRRDDDTSPSRPEGHVHVPPGGPAISSGRRSPAPVAQPPRKAASMQQPQYHTLKPSSSSNDSVRSEPAGHYATMRSAKSPTPADNPRSPPSAALSALSVSAKSPPLRTPSPALASSSLASFYANDVAGGRGNEATDTVGTIASPPRRRQASSLDAESGPEGAAASATDFYAALAAQPTPIDTNSTAGEEVSSSHHRERSVSPVAAPRVPSVLQSIAAKFDHPPIDLTASSKRVLLKEGFLQRQATFKNVERYCYCFNDLFIVTEPAKSATASSASSSSSATSPVATKLIMKQIVSLDEAHMEWGKKATVFILQNPDKPLYFECATIEEAHEWYNTLEAAIASYTGRSRGVSPRSANNITTGTFSPNSIDSETLFTAVFKKNDTLLIDVLERGDDPNEADAQQMTPLHHAVVNGYVTGVTLLLGHEADMTLKNADGKTSIHLAALHDEYAILLVFLQRQPDLDSLLDLDGRSPLWDLVQGPYRANERLVEEGGGEGDDPTAAVAKVTSPLSKSGHRKQKIVASHESGSQLENSATDESNAEDDDDDATAAAEVASPLSPSQKDLRTRESLQRNAWKNMTECLNVMIEQHCDLEQRDRHGATVLMHLASVHAHEALQLLISVGASLTSIDNDGATALHYSVCPDLSDGRVDDNELSDVIATVQHLLQAGLCPNLRDHHGRTPLHLCKSLPTAGCLVVHGARLDLKDENGVKASAYFEEQAAKGDPNDPLAALKAARDQWLSRGDTFLPPTEDLDGITWMDDELSSCCLLCSESFSMLKRRHHCRRCTLLCCANCSSKKFTNSRKKEEGLRCCDGCYNFMAHKYVAYAKQQRRAQAAKRAEELALAKERERLHAEFDASHKAFLRRSAEEEQRVKEKRARIEEMKQPDYKPPPRADKRGSMTSSAASSSSSSSATATAASKAASTSERMQQNRQLALERGEKLARLEDKAQRMEDDAANFASMASKLKDKYKNSWW